MQKNLRTKFADAVITVDRYKIYLYDAREVETKLPLWAGSISAWQYVI